MNDAVMVSAPSEKYWFRAPVYQAMMVVTFVFIVLGLATDVHLGLWAEQETVLQPLLGTALFKATAIVFMIIFLLYCTPLLKTRLQILIKSWNYQEISFLLLFLWFNSSISCGLKSVLSRNIPFYADPYLYQIEKIVHFGVTPTELLYNYIVTPFFIEASLICYSSWFFVGLSFLIVNIWGVPGKYGRERIVLCFVMCWLLNGTILAAALSSVGPLFLDEFFPNFRDHPYLPFVDMALKTHPLLGDIKELLLKMVLILPYTDKNGISAMPSMHVTICALMYFAVREYWPKFSIFFFWFMVLTLVSCLVILTHYAVDGYVAILVVWGIWRWSARFKKDD